MSLGFIPEGLTPGTAAAPTSGLSNVAAGITSGLSHVTATTTSGLSQLVWAYFDLLSQLGSRTFWGGLSSALSALGWGLTLDWFSISNPEGFREDSFCLRRSDWFVICSTELSLSLLMSLKKVLYMGCEKKTFKKDIYIYLIFFIVFTKPEVH